MSYQQQTLAAQVAEMRQEIQRLKSELRRRPLTAGGGGGSDNNIWQLVEGVTILPATVTGTSRQWVADITTHTIAEVDSLLTPTSLDDGVGIAVNLATAARKLVWHGNPSPLRHDLWVDMIFISYLSLDILITGDPDDRNQNFIVPAAVLS